MPFINVYISQELTEENAQQLTKGVADAVAKLPVIVPEKVVVNLNTSCPIYRLGERDDSGFVDIRIRKNADITMAMKVELVESLYKLFVGVLQVPEEKIQFNILEMEHWGSRGSYR